MYSVGQMIPGLAATFCEEDCVIIVYYKLKRNSPLTKMLGVALPLYSMLLKPLLDTVFDMHLRDGFGPDGIGPEDGNTGYQ